jgi:hypothetical protein
MVRLRQVARERGSAQRLLLWRDGPLGLEAEVSATKYFLGVGPYEVAAWAEVRDWGGRRRVEVGRFSSLPEAKAACEQHAAARRSMLPRSAAAKRGVCLEGGGVPCPYVALPCPWRVTWRR